MRGRTGLLGDNFGSSLKAGKALRECLISVLLLWFLCFVLAVWEIGSRDASIVMGTVARLTSVQYASFSDTGAAGWARNRKSLIFHPNKYEIESHWNLVTFEHLRGNMYLYNPRAWASHQQYIPEFAGICDSAAYWLAWQDNLNLTRPMSPVLRTASATQRQSREHWKLR